LSGVAHARGMYATHAPVPATEAPLPGSEAVLVGLVALGVVFVPFLWPLVEQFNVMAHEGAHAIVGSIMGFGIKGVKLDGESRGVTSYINAPETGPRRTLTRFVGYLGPSGFGLCAAKLIETGHVVTVLWVAIMLLVLLLFLIRKSFAIISVPAAIALLAYVLRHAHDGLEEVIVYGMTWLLLLSGVRVAVADGANAGDAGNLSRTTHIPSQIWALLWLAGTLLAVVIGGKWLVLRS
jgi:Peptidase M50B-like